MLKRFEKDLRLGSVSEMPVAQAKSPEFPAPELTCVQHVGTQPKDPVWRGRGKQRLGLTGQPAWIKQENLDSVRNPASKRKGEKLEDSGCQPSVVQLHTYTLPVNKCKHTHFTFLKTKSPWSAREMAQWSSVQTAITGT